MNYYGLHTPKRYKEKLVEDGSMKTHWFSVDFPTEIKIESCIVFIAKSSYCVCFIMYKVRTSEELWWYLGLILGLTLVGGYIPLPMSNFLLGNSGLVIIGNLAELNSIMKFNTLIVGPLYPQNGKNGISKKLYDESQPINFVRYIQCKFFSALYLVMCINLVLQ